MMTFQEKIMANLKARYPTSQFVLDKAGSAIGAWIETPQRFKTTAIKTITGEWVLVGVDENLDGGGPLRKPEDWDVPLREVPKLLNETHVHLAARALFGEEMAEEFMKFFRLYKGGDRPCSP